MNALTPRFQAEVWPTIRSTWLSDLNETAAINCFNSAVAAEGLFDNETRKWSDAVFKSGAAKFFGTVENPGPTFWDIPKAVRFFGEVIIRFRNAKTAEAINKQRTPERSSRGCFEMPFGTDPNAFRNTK